MTQPITDNSAPRTKADIARENGAKSHGPVTDAGRARSSLNSVKHSLAGTTIILSTEDQEAFKLHHQSYVDSLKPVNPVEGDLVYDMVVSKWQERRCDLIEAAVINLQLNLDQQEFEKNSVSPDESTRLAVAFLELSDHSKVLQLLLRYRTEHGRRYNRALRQLLALREKGAFNQPVAKPAAAPNAEKRNEPTVALNPRKTDEPPPPTTDPQPTPNPDPAAQPIISCYDIISGRSYFRRVSRPRGVPLSDPPVCAFQ